MSDSTTIEQKKKKKSTVNTKNELKQHVSDYHLDSNGDKIKKDTIEPNDTLRTVIGDADQGYYIQVGLRMTSRLAGLLFAIQKGSVKHNRICLC